MKHHLLLGVRGARRIGGFGLSVILFAAGSLVLVPATIAAGGLETWASIVLGQNLAVIITVVGGCGYDVNGPATLATLTPGESAEYFFVAQRTRLASALPSCALLVALMLVIPNPDPVAGLLGCAPLAVSIFSAAFYFIGRGDPRSYLLADTVPRVVGNIAGASALALGTPLLIGLALPVIGAVIAVIAPILAVRMSAIRTTGEPPLVGNFSVRGQLRTQLRPTGSQLLTHGTRAMPVLMVTGVAPALVAAFGVFDRLQKQAATALFPITASFQEWVPRRMATDRNVRPAIAATAIGFAVAVGLVGAFTVVGPTFIRWFSGGELVSTRLEAFLCGAVIANILLIALVGYACVVPLAGVASVLVANVVGLLMIATALPVMLAIERSLSHALLAVVIGNVAQLLVLLLIMSRRIVQGWEQRTETYE
jgi:hypothetical protein